jgi:hypothetical protein
MPKIKIKDLPKDKKVSEKEIKRITGGLLQPLPSLGERRARLSSRGLTGTLAWSDGGCCGCTGIRG